MRKKFVMIFPVITAIAMLAGACKSPDQITQSNIPEQSPQEITIKQEPAEVKDLISVKGSGKVMAKPDMATVVLGVTTRGQDPITAQNANNAAMEAVYAALDALGIKKEDIVTSGLSMNPDYSYEKETPEIIGYTVSNILTVQVRDLAKLSDVLTKSIEAGANNVNGITFGINDSQQAYKDALKAAMQDARGKAEAIAEAAGIKQISDVPVSVDETSYSYTPVEYKNVERAEDLAAGVPVSEGQLTINADVSVTYEILGNEQN
jgi:uncharacterized protein YggE